MSERTAIRIGAGLTVAVAAVAWCTAAWLLLRTSVPTLHLAGFDQHRIFTANELTRSAHYSHGLQALWLAGMIWRLSVAAGSGLRVAQIRRGCVPSGSGDGISIYSSDAVELPLSMGFARPAIVLPRRFLDLLTPESLECVVQHEIAHVLRKDVWTKGAQLFIEALLFFNPAVLFIGRKIAFEREAACDDRAIARIPDVRNYADCLARVASLVS